MGNELLSQIGANAAEQATGGIIGAGMGLLLEKHNDKRQIKQQQKLTDMQLAANKAMGIFNAEQAMKMWHDTNYSAQMEEIEKAGLNPGLLYGMGGAGGATTQGGQGGGMSGASAPMGGQEIMGMMMNKAQIDLIKAQTEKTKAETGNVPLTGKNIAASTGNIEADTAIKNIQQEMTGFQRDITALSKDKQAQAIIDTADKIAEELKIIKNSTDISNETKESTIQRMKTEAANAILTGAVMKQGIEVDKAQINKMAQDIIQRGKEINIKEFEAEFKSNNPNFTEIGGSMMNSIKRALDKIMGISDEYVRPNQVKQ